MQLSVVVCTFNRYDALANCLDALRPDTQTAPGTAYEVIVVDNTPKANRRSRRGFRVDKWATCDEIGLSNARNTGIAAAQGDIIAFIDDDALPVREWCREVIGVFGRHPQALAAGGKAVPEYPGGFGPAWMTPKLTEYLSCVDWGEDEHVLRDGEWIVGANMAFRRGVFEGAALFDPGLGRKGNLGLLSNEEIALIHRIGRQHIVYSPAMMVRHVISQDRLTQTWFRKRVFWQAMSDQLAGIDVPATGTAWEEIRRIAPLLPAERRNLNGLSAECGDAQEFTIQLRQLYLLAHLLAGGMAA
jgi:glucosyl-dolichyl phosphate glucuronosyltransferase